MSTTRVVGVQCAFERAPDTQQVHDDMTQVHDLFLTHRPFPLGEFASRLPSVISSPVSVRVFPLFSSPAIAATHTSRSLPGLVEAAYRGPRAGWVGPATGDWDSAGSSWRPHPSDEGNAENVAAILSDADSLAFLANDRLESDRRSFRVVRGRAVKTLTQLAAKGNPKVIEIAEKAMKDLLGHGGLDDEETGRVGEALSLVRRCVPLDHEETREVGEAPAIAATHTPQSGWPAAAGVLWPQPAGAGSSWGPPPAVAPAAGELAAERRAQQGASLSAERLAAILDDVTDKDERIRVGDVKALVLLALKDRNAKLMDRARAEEMMNDDDLLGHGGLDDDETLEVGEALKLVRRFLPFPLRGKGRGW